MKKFIAALALVLCASFAFGQDDITIDNNNVIHNTNTNTATSNAHATGGTSEATGGAATVNFNNANRREHITAQPGPSGSFVSGMQLALPAGCVPITGSISLKKVKKMAKSGSFTEKKGGMWHGFFSDRNKPVPYEDFDDKPSEERFYFYSWDPTKTVVDWDSITMESFCEGDYGYPLGSALGKCLEDARETVNASHVLACYTVRYDNHASGASYGGGGTGSIIKGGENDTKAGSVAIGGLMGTTVGYYNKAYDVYLVGLSGAYTVSPKPTPAPTPACLPVPTPVPTPDPTPQVCNISIYTEKIEAAEKRIDNCWRYGHSNMVDRLTAAKENVNAWLCSNKTETKYLREAIEHYQMAELNSIHGWDIKKYSDSDAIIAEVEYGLASAFYARDGHINNFWVAPEVVVHENKKTGKEKPVATTAYEKREILKIRHTLEKYSKNLTLN